jgi:hypothetical protein
VVRKDRVTLTGDAGTSYSKAFAGLLVGFYVDKGTLAATTDVTITDGETGNALLTITNLAANKLYLPRALNQDLAGADTTLRERIPINGAIKFVVAQGGASNTGTVYVYVDEGAS